MKTAPRSRSRSGWVGWALVASLALPGLCRSESILSDADPIDPATGRAAEIVPGAPLTVLTATGEEEVRVEVDPGVVGDIDLVVRTGSELTGPVIPPPRALDGFVPTGVAEPYGKGKAIPIVVSGSAWASPLFPYGLRTELDFDQVPVVVVAFPDYDGDGYVGITELDGDPDDTAIEREELVPVAQRVVFAQAGLAELQLPISVGGPRGAELRVALTAAAYIGPRRTGFFAGLVPDGPGVFTHLPFLPHTDKRKIIGVGPNGPDLRLPLEIISVDVVPAFEPNPEDETYGESYTLRTDGTTASIDIADVGSGSFAGFAIARPATAMRSQKEDDDEDGGEAHDEQRRRAHRRSSKVLRPGLDARGERALYEIITRIELGADDVETLRVVPADCLGNVTAPPGPLEVTVWTRGGAEIRWPDRDGDPYRETLEIEDARGAELSVGAPSHLPAERDTIVFESGPVVQRLDVRLDDD